ncbi:hypothetical protein ACROYT_G002264 [Oculina patagonica]
MPESCVKKRHCGTHAPGWLDGSHPTMADGAVKRKVCFHWSDNCCRWSTVIDVRNCGGFYVYKLHRPPACTLRYCGNGIPSARECSNYTYLEEGDRAVGNSNKRPIKCDRSLREGWYRFRGNAGNEMASSCPPKQRCGTRAPGWLNGSHPSVAEGTVQRQVEGATSLQFTLLRKSSSASIVNSKANNNAPNTDFLFRFLNESNRAKTYNKPSPYICDSSLSGWYRFGGEAGSQMPESCVKKRHCGTHAPGWLDGSHPTMADGAVKRKVCFHWSDNCCRWSTMIDVRNCGGFYVYKLHRPPACTLRYCGNGIPSARECSNYTYLEEGDRAVGNSNKRPIKCDRSLREGWYRFRGNAGNEMASSCPPKQRCGTRAPGWLNGSHPSVAEGTVQRQVEGATSLQFTLLRKSSSASIVNSKANNNAPNTDFLFRFLNESNRAKTYNKPSPYICDSSLSGWYRFGGEAGSQMPESCVKKRHCGTHAPGWLDGSHPTMADGAVKRKVCFHWSDNCCRWSTMIDVRNCGGFYVYKLHRPPACTLRYCGNGLPPAPECSNYNYLEEGDRAVGNTNRRPIKCDRSLKEGWYRFRGSAGNKMASSCPPKLRCGTHAPGWLNGSHPSVAEGAVQRRVCFHWSSGCCQWENHIQVRNCSGYYVYQLKPTRFCSLRYCGNREAPRPSTPTPLTPTPTRARPIPTSYAACSNYRFLNESNRAKTYNKPSPYICDSSLSGWYRFGGEAGSQMPESCVKERHCGTHAPGWLNGSHPTVADGAVKRKVCFHWSKRCCRWSTVIEVRNCGGFYVYKLHRPPACTLRYCGNGLSPTTASTPTSKPTIQPSPTRPNHGFMILCLPVAMKVNISRNLLPPSMDPSLLHLNDPGCGALHVDQKYVVMETPLKGCGTVRRSIGRTVLFHNRVVVPSAYGRKRTLLEFPFACTYNEFGFPGIINRPALFHKRGHGTSDEIAAVLDTLEDLSNEDGTCMQLNDINTSAIESGPRQVLKDTGTLYETKQESDEIGAVLDLKDLSEEDVILPIATLKVQPGRNVQFPCQVTAGESFVAWITPAKAARPGKPGIPSVRITTSQTVGRRRIAVFGNTYQLLMDSVTVDDGGNYVCQGESNSAVFTLEVDFSTAQVDTKQEIHLGRKDVIKLDVTSYPLPTYEWTKDGTPLTFPTQGKTLDPYTGSITIDNVKLSDQGNYTCKVTFGISDSVKIEVVVIDEPQIRKYEGEPVRRRLTKGDNVTFHCEVQSGSPKPEVTWWFGWIDTTRKVDVNYDARYSHPTDETWTITGIDTNDAGRYRCRAKNIAGEDFLKFEITHVDTISPTKSSGYIQRTASTAVKDNFGIVEPFPENLYAFEFTSANVTCVAYDSSGIKIPAKILFVRKNEFNEYRVLTANYNLYFTNRTEENGRKLFVTLHFRRITMNDDSLSGPDGTYECHAFAVGDRFERARHGFSVVVLRVPPTSMPSITPTTPTAPPCTYYLNQRYGNFTSPNYPSHYPDNQYCTWLIEAPTGQKIYLHFESFALEYHRNCQYDVVEVFNGNSGASPMIKRACGRQPPCGMYSSGRFLFVKFTTDFSGTDRGFSASYYALSHSVGYGQSQVVNSNSTLWCNLPTTALPYPSTHAISPTSSSAYIPSTASPTECFNYTILDEFDRAKGYKGVVNKCDSSLLKRWYRFLGLAGKQMPDACVAPERCGTQAPGWLSGGHPTVAQGAVQRTVCFSYSSFCCLLSTSIRVRNCGAFYVYELPPTDGCNMRYCGDREQVPTPNATQVPTPTPTHVPPTSMSSIRPTTPTECFNYTILDEFDRAKGYKGGVDKCDRSLPKGWYRFLGLAGKQMPGACVAPKRCGTQAPGWLIGGHPTVAQGAVERTVCFSWSTYCCPFSTIIRVRNCGAFYVYELPPTDGCNLRYCGDREQVPTPNATQVPTPSPTHVPPTSMPSITPTTPTECFNFTILDEFDRAKGYKGVINKCDRSLLKGWYRFQEFAGKQMPDACVAPDRCGTQAPGWLSGGHPTVAQGAVQRRACFSWYSGCCRWSTSIRVRNCGAFYVYELPPTPNCNLRYCGDREQGIIIQFALFAVHV